MMIQKPRIKNLESFTFKKAQNEQIYENLFFSVNPSNNISFSDITFDSCKFEKIDFKFLKLKNVFFCDCIFEHVDLSNFEFYKVNFTRCRFIDCKMIGTSFIDSVLTDISISSSLLRYGNFANCKVHHFLLEKTDCCQASFHYIHVKDIFFSQCNLKNTEFLETPLNEVDLSNSTIEGIIIDLKSLKGAKVSFEQAASLAQILGITII